MSELHNTGVHRSLNLATDERHVRSVPQLASIWNGGLKLLDQTILNFSPGLAKPDYVSITPGHQKRGAQGIRVSCVQSAMILLLILLMSQPSALLKFDVFKDCCKR